TTERGLKLFEEIMGPERAAAMKGAVEAGGFISSLATLALDFAFAGVWARPGLERKQRSLVTLGVLIAQGQTAEVRNHIRIALANGLTVTELEEAFIQTTPYVGFPLQTSSTTVLIEVLREEG